LTDFDSLAKIDVSPADDELIRLDHFVSFAQQGVALVILYLLVVHHH